MNRPGDVPAMVSVVAAYWAAVAALVYLSMAGTAGVLVYPLDDTYIHMAMAKNMAVHGVWGVTPEGFTSATSSPLWTGVLAATYVVAGVSDWAPLILNLLAGTVLVISLYALFANTGLAAATAAMSATGIAFAGTLPTMTVIGMEHVLHALATVWFVVLGARQAGRDEPAGVWPVAVLAAAVTLTRYEGVFAVAAVVLALWIARRWRAGVVIAVAGAIPILLYGLWSQSQGGFLLPNSVLLKGVAPVMSVTGLLQLAMFWTAITGLMANPHLAFLVIAVLGLAALPRRDADAREREVLALIFVACTLLHLQFARVGWFFRYEAYLVVLGLVVVATLVGGVAWPAMPWLRNRFLATITVALLTGVLAFPLVRRGANALRQAPAAAANIFAQPYQAGLFLAEFYRGRRVAVNDIGAVGYLADVTLLDVWGLASREVADLKRRRAYTTAALSAIAARQDVEVAVIHPGLLDEAGGVPPAWQLVGEWRINDNVVLGASAISFYAVKAGARDALIDHLVTFADRLPASVVQGGLYRAHQ